MILLLAAALAAPLIRTERVDLFSEEAGSLWIDDLPRIGIAPRITAIRWLEQVRFAAEIPRLNLVLGASVGSQSVSWRQRVTPRSRIYGSVGVTTRLGLPRGLLVGIETWAGPLRLGAGVHAYADASWARPSWNKWTVRPGLGIGFGRAPRVF